MLFSDLIQKRFFEEVRDYKNKSLLDVGCGNMPYKKIVSESNSYIGIDVEVSGRSSENKNADFYFDGENIPYEDKVFDMVICNQVLEHAVEPEKLVK